MATPAHSLNLCGVISETRRIINSHSNFLALYVIFLLPLSFSLTSFPTLLSTLSHHPNPTNTQFHPILCSIFIAVLSICAVATITYNTYHGFYGRSIKLGSAIKSLLHSFLPLLATNVASQLVAGLISSLFFFLFIFMTQSAGFLGFQIEYESNLYFGLSIFVATVLGLALISLQVQWALASVIVVTESKWGFEPLWRSAYLTKGMRYVSLSLLLLYGFPIGFMIWMDSTSTVMFSGGFDILRTVINSIFVAVLMLGSTAANTVFYMYCKALHGELALEIAEEFAGEYVRLPFDSEKFPNLVPVVHA